MSYTPPKEILEKYADVLVNFALGGGKGIQKGEVVRVMAGESAKPLYFEICKAVWKAGANVIEKYQPDDDAKYNLSRTYFELASEEQLDFFAAKMMRGMADDIDHHIYVVGEADTHALEGVDPAKIMRSGKARKPLMDWLAQKESAGKFSWTLALYGTPAMAAEVGMTEAEYWEQIIQACFLDESDPIAKWRQVIAEIDTCKQKLNALSIDRLHIEGVDVDLWIKLGEGRQWQGGGGQNIPSFEIFTSPDWRGTNGWVRFNQPLYRYGNLVTGIELKFKDGLVIESKADKNYKVLKEMIATENANKIGEFSLTDSRFSRITKFMGETLFDENVGGQFGNTHLALGDSYHDCYDGDPFGVSKDEWERLGFNNSSVHTDIISTTDRTVTAIMTNGAEQVIYKNGQFQV